MPLFLMIEYKLSTGDFFDRVSIWQVKYHKTTKFFKEYTKGWQIVSRMCSEIDGNRVFNLYSRLVTVNTRLWEVEDSVREAVVLGDVEGTFELSKDIIHFNDLRSNYKREVDVMFGDVGDGKAYSGSKAYTI